MMVDADFLGRLLAGSMEARVGAVEEAIQASSALFGGDDDTKVQLIATYESHAIVANNKGDFFKVSWEMNESGSVSLEEAKEIDVPVYEASQLTSQAREKSIEVVEAMLGGANDTTDRVRDLVGLAFGGPRLTAEGVEDHWGKRSFVESDWHKATKVEESRMRGFIGAELNRLNVPKPKFEAMIESDLTEDQEEGHRGNVLRSLENLSKYVVGLGDRLVLATTIDEGCEVVGGDSMAAADFASFVDSFVEDYEDLTGTISDAIAVSEDGCVKCLARLHDGVAGQMYEWALAAAFIEKLARRFKAPQAA
jgi:hypothetical protein